MTYSDNQVKKYSAILEHIDGHGMIESYGNDHAIVAYNSFEQSYRLNKESIYITCIEEPIIKKHGEDPYLSFILSDDKSFFQKQCAIDCGFYYSEQHNNSEYYRIYFFKSYHHITYERLINNVELVKGLISFFKDHNQQVINTFAQIRADFDNQKNAYFRSPNNLQCYSDQDKLLDILRFMNVLNEDSLLTHEEWSFINTYNYGELYNVDMNHIFNLSKDEMVNRFNQIVNNLLKKQIV